MPEISKKGHNMPQSPIRKLVPYAEEATKKGKKVYYLNIGQPDIKTPTIAMNAIRSSSLDILAYSRSEGSEEYRMWYRDQEFYSAKREWMIEQWMNSHRCLTLG